MPRKDKDEYRKYMKKYMQAYRKQNPKVLVNQKKLQNLQKQYPDVYTLFFGKKKGKKK